MNIDNNPIQLASVHSLTTLDSIEAKYLYRILHGVDLRHIYDLRTLMALVIENEYQ